MGALRILFMTVMLFCFCDGTYFFKPKKIFLPPIHHMPHMHPHPHPHPHHHHHHHHHHGMKDHGHFHKFHKTKILRPIIHHKIHPLLKPVMYKTFLIRKYSLPPNFHVHIPLNKKIYAHTHGPPGPHTHYPEKPMFMMQKRKMKKLFRPKQVFPPRGYQQPPAKNSLRYRTIQKYPQIPDPAMQMQTNMFLPTGILPPPKSRPPKTPGINKYDLWLRKINEWMIKNQNTAKGLPVKRKRKRIINKIHMNVPTPVQKLNIKKPEPKKKNDGIIANFVVVKPPFISKSEETAVPGIPVFENPKPSIKDNILDIPKLDMKLRPTAPVMGIPISLDDIGPPFDINVANDKKRGDLPPPIEIVDDPGPSRTGDGDRIDIGIPVSLSPGPFESDSVTPPNIIIDGLPTEQNVNSIVPLPGKINDMLTNVGDLSHFPNLDLSNEPLIIEPFMQIPPLSQTPMPFDIQPFPWDVSQIPFPPEIIPRTSNKEKEPYVMKPLEPIVKMIGRDSVKRKNDTVFVPKPILDPEYNDTEIAKEAPYNIFTEGPVDVSTNEHQTSMPPIPLQTIKHGPSEASISTTAQPSTKYQTTFTLPPLSLMEFKYSTSSPDITTQTTTMQNKETAPAIMTTTPLPTIIPVPDPSILVNGSTGEGQHNVDMVDQIKDKEQQNDTAFFKYRPEESFPYLSFHGPKTSTAASKISDTRKETTTAWAETTASQPTTKLFKETPGVQMFTTTLPAPVTNDQVNEEIILDFMTDKQIRSSRSDVVLDYSTSDKDQTTTMKTQERTSSKRSDSTSTQPTTAEATTSTTTLPTTTQLLTIPSSTTKITLKNRTTPKVADVSMDSSTTQSVSTTKSTSLDQTTESISSTTSDYYSETPTYDYVTDFYDLPFNWTENSTFAYFDDVLNITQQTTEIRIENTTTPTVKMTSTPTPSTSILVSSKFSSSHNPTTTMMDFRGTKQTTTLPSPQTSDLDQTTTNTFTELTSTTEKHLQTSLSQTNTTTPIATGRSTTMSNNQNISVTTSTPRSTTTEGAKICQQTYCQIGHECTEDNTWLCPDDAPGTDCQCTQGCREGQMFIPLGESFYVDECGSACSCFNLYGKAECQKMQCPNSTVADPEDNRRNYTGISIGGVIYIPVQRVKIPKKTKSKIPGDDGYTYGISIGGVIYIPKRNHTNAQLDKNTNWTSGISLGGVIYVPSREHTNEQNGNSDYENVVDGNSSWTKGITIGGIIYVPVHKRKKTFQEKNKEFEKIYDKTEFADADVISVETPYGSTRGITIGGVIYIPNKKRNEPVHFLGGNELQSNNKNQTSPIQVEYPLGWTDGISIGGIIYVPVQQRRKVQNEPVYLIPNIKTEPDNKNNIPYLTKTAGIHIGGIINVPIAKRSSIKSIKIKKINPAFG